MDDIQESGSAGKLLAQSARPGLAKSNSSRRHARNRTFIDYTLHLAPEVYLASVRGTKISQRRQLWLFITRARVVSGVSLCRTTAPLLTSADKDTALKRNKATDEDRSG